MIRQLVLCLLPSVLLFANTFENLGDALKKLQEAMSEESDEGSFTCTSHTIHLPNGPLSYTAITGTLPQRSNNGKILGKIFFTAYLKDAEKDLSIDSLPEGWMPLQMEKERPLTFIFNGGPGGSSLSMHIGGFGPRRILFPIEGQKEFPPYELTDNPETLLELSDLVFVDPMGTGYSEVESREIEYAFYSCEGDIASLSEFIRLFCIHFNLWNAPKYLAGASYGAPRICGMAEYLHDHLGTATNGLLLLSPALDFSTRVHSRDNPLPDCLQIPSMAATAWYHKKSNQNLTLEETVEYARRFAMEEYLPAFLNPTKLSPFERANFYAKLANLIGLPIATIERYQGRIKESVYISEFFASERILIGGTDSRYKGPVSPIAGEYLEDPSYRDIRPAFYPSFLHYLQNELDTSLKFPDYKSFNPRVNYLWDFDTHDSWGLPNFMQRLRRTLVDSPRMKVFVGLGYFDLRTPFGATEYSLNHLELPDEYRKNFQFEYYKAGHGFIFDLPSLQQFKQHLIRFYEQ